MVLSESAALILEWNVACLTPALLISLRPGVLPRPYLVVISLTSTPCSAFFFSASAILRPHSSSNRRYVSTWMYDSADPMSSTSPSRPSAASHSRDARFPDVLTSDPDASSRSARALSSAGTSDFPARSGASASAFRFPSRSMNSVHPQRRYTTNPRNGSMNTIATQNTNVRGSNFSLNRRMYIATASTIASGIHTGRTA